MHTECEIDNNGYLNQNIGPAFAGSAGPALPPLVNAYYFIWEAGVTDIIRARVFCDPLAAECIFAVPQVKLCNTLYFYKGICLIKWPCKSVYHI